MPTLEELFLNDDTDIISYEVRVNGAVIPEVLTIELGFNISGVPHATFAIRGPAPVIIAFNATVTIDAGYAGFTTRVFTGNVQHIQPNEEGRSVECQGKTWALDVPFHKVVVTLNNIAQDTALTNLVVASGIRDYNITVPTPVWQIGTVVPQTLEFQTYGDAINKVGEPNGVRWYETPTGTLILAPLDPIPSTTAWRTYFSMHSFGGVLEAYPAPEITSGRPHIVNCSGQQSIRDVKNRAYVRGATYTQTNPDGTTEPIDIEVFAQAPSPWVINPDGSQAYNDELFANELIDTVVFASAVAARLVGIKNRLFTRISLTLDKMDPEITVGRTIRIVDPDYSGIVGNFFVEAYNSRLSGDGECQTTITAVGGDSAGQTVNVNPVALFTHKVVRQVQGNKTWAAVTVDARGSIDFDGTVVSVSWTDNQAIHVASGTGFVRTFVYDPAALNPTTLTITATATDNLGATGTLTLTIDLSTTGETVTQPALFTAFDPWMSASPDGGINWNDQAATDHAISVDAKPDDGSHAGWAVYGTQGGALYLTKDYCATAPVQKMAGVGSPMVHVWWDKQHPNDVWAVTQDGRLYRSEATNGETWVLYENLRVKLGLPNLRANRIATPPPDGVWIFGGDGTGPMIIFDPVRSHAWGHANIGGELATDLGSGSFTGKFQYEAYQIHNDRDLYGFNPVTATWTRVKQQIHTSGYHGQLRTDRNTGFMYLLHAPSGTGNFDFPGKTMCRSVDGGLNWTSIWDVVLNPCPSDPLIDGYGVRDYDIDAAGNLYIVVGSAEDISDNTNNCVPMKIYKSTNQGASWQLLYTAPAFDYAGGFYTNCAPLPWNITVTADGQHIFVGTRSPWTSVGQPVGYYSGDFGNSFIRRYTDGVITSGNSTLTDHVHFVNNNRLVWFKCYTTPKVYISDNFGLTWTLLLTVPYLAITGAPWWRPTWGDNWGFWAVENAAAGKRPMHLYVTTNNGANIAEVTFPLVPSTDGQSEDVFAYDPLLDVTYLADDAPTNASNNSELRILHPFNPATHTATVVKSGFVATPATIDGFQRTDIPEAVGVSRDVYIVDAATRVGQTSTAFAIILDSSTMPAGPYCTDDILGDGTHWKRPIGAPPGKTHGKWLSPNLEGGKFSFGYDDNNFWNGDVGASGAIQCAKAVATMDAGDVANHGLWEGELLGNIADVYLVSAEGTADGTIYKTFDRFATVGKVRPAAGFPAAPAGANAKMTAISGAGQQVVTAARVAIVYPKSGGGTSRAIAFPNSTLTGWTTVDLPAAIDHERPRPFCLSPLVWVVTDVGGFPDPEAKSAGSQFTSAAVISVDGGATWNSTAIGDEDPTSPSPYKNGLAIVAMDAGGQFWGARRRGGTTAQPIALDIYKSPSGLTGTWTLVTSLSVASAGRYPIRFFTHPLNQNIIGIISAQHYGPAGGDNGVIVFYTNDRGTTWITNDPSVASGNNFALDHGTPPDFILPIDVMLLTSGRLVLTNGSGSTFLPGEVWTSDDYGLHWTRRAFETNTNTRYILAGGDPTGSKIVLWRFKLANTGSDPTNVPVISTDGGINWSPLAVQALKDFAGDANVGNTNDVAARYDPRTDTLFVWSTASTRLSTKRVYSLSPVSASGVWKDVTGNLPANSASTGWNNIDIIPSTSVVPQQPSDPVPPTPPPDTNPPPPPPGSGSTGSRDKLKQPFASTSIWNMPIGSGAQLVPANIPTASNFRADEDIIVMKPTSPSRQVWTNNVGWDYNCALTRCTETNYAGFDVPIPDSFVLPEVCPDYPNSCGAFLLADGRTLRQFQPVTRCTASGHVTAYDISPPLQDIYGDGIYGAHGGSGLSSIGGTIRLGELVPGGVIRHALKLNVNAEVACSGVAGGFRWPATQADGCAPGCYGGNNPAVRMGSLCCLRSDFNINGLETAPAKIIAQALIDYGCYIVDSTSWDAYAFATERGPDGRVAGPSGSSEFFTKWGFVWDVDNNAGSAWGRDIQRMCNALYVVNNNSPTAVGGGGTPRVALAPPLA